LGGYSQSAAILCPNGSINYFSVIQNNNTFLTEYVIYDNSTKLTANITEYSRYSWGGTRKIILND